MAVINLFIAFFVIVALAISWLVFNLVFGTRPQMATTGDGENFPAVPETGPEEPVVEAPASPVATKIDSIAIAEPPIKKGAGSAAVRTVKKKTVKAGTGKAKTAPKKKSSQSKVKSSQPKRKVGRPKKSPGSTCLDEMVTAAKALTQEKGADEFAAKEIVDYLVANGTAYSVGTIRSQLVSRATDAESSNGDGPKDFERVKRGVYRLSV